MSRQSGIEYKARIGMKADGLGFGVGSTSGGSRGGLGGSHGPAGDGGSGQGGPDDSGGGKGGSSLGFIAAYALVLGLSGYVVMTDDSATAGGFSLFAQSEEEESSFSFKPSVTVLAIVGVIVVALGMIFRRDESQDYEQIYGSDTQPLKSEIKSTHLIFANSISHFMQAQREQFIAMLWRQVPYLRTIKRRAEKADNAPKPKKP